MVLHNRHGIQRGEVREDKEIRSMQTNAAFVFVNVYYIDGDLSDEECSNVVKYTTSKKKILIDKNFERICK